jgi:hypothetical protein
MPSILLGPQIGPRALKRLTPPSDPTSYVITARDERILDGLARFRFMHTEQAAIWAGGSVRGVRTRLYHLWADGLVSRPLQQATHLQNFFHHGAIPLVYELGRKATKYLSDRGVPLTHRLDWSFRDGAAPEMPHALAVTDCMLAIHQAVAAVDGVGIVDHTELLPSFPEATQRSRRPFRIWADVTDRDGATTSRGTIPDRLFSLHFGEERVNFALEIDMASETLDPKKLGTKGTIRSKHAVYFNAFLQQRFATVWNFERLRVLFVVPSETRINNMIKVQQVTTSGHAAGMFLYATPQRLAQHGILGPAWKSADADGVSILPTPTSARS